MGLSIHYKGLFNSSMELEDLIEEVRDFGEANNWKYTIFETDFKVATYATSYGNLFGIILSPPGCEPVQFTFSEDFKMCSFVYVNVFKSDPDMDILKGQLFTKTQYAGIDVHIKVVNLFRHISKKYFTSFEMIDEGKYWETNDGNILKEQFVIYNKFTDLIELGMQSIPIKENESIDEYIKRVVIKVKEN